MTNLVLDTELTVLFTKACENDNLTKVVSIWNKAMEKGKYVSLTYNNDMPLKHMCGDGNVEGVKWMINKSRYLVDVMGISDQEFTSFSSSFDGLFAYCVLGTVECAKFVYGYCSDNNIELELHPDNYQAFSYCCEEGDLDMIRWLFSISSKHQRTCMGDIIDEEDLISGTFLEELDSIRVLVSAC